MVQTSVDTPQNNALELSPETPKKYRSLDILLRNPVAYPVEQLCKDMELSESAVYSMVGRLRKERGTNYKLIMLNKKITIRVNNRKPTESDIMENIKKGNQAAEGANMSVIEKVNEGKKDDEKVDFYTMREKAHEIYGSFLNLLKMNPEGIHINKICETLDVDKQRIYNVAYALRKQGNGILSTNGVYKLYNKPKEPAKTKNVPAVNSGPKTPVFNSSLIPPEYMGMFNNLPDDDKVDCIDMLKKSLYYKKSALALIEANQLAFNFCKTLTNGGI